MDTTTPDAPDTVWANVWNPPTDMWSPSAEPHNTYGVAEPGHGDIADAMPMSDDPGDTRTHTAGTIPDVRGNLLTEVKDRHVVAPPTHSVVHHIVETAERGAPTIRAAMLRVNGNTTETVLLDENPDRRRALIKIITSASIIVVGPMRQGGNPAFTGAPAGQSAFYPIATGDPVHEVKSGAGVSAFGTTASPGFVDVAIWEELENSTSSPGSVG